MREYFEKSVNGWLNFSVNGKTIALLFVSIGILWLVQRKNTNKVFRAYLSVMTIACICPVTACFLMLYQTRFYDYPWIWSLVPITGGIAYGVTICNREIWTNLTITKSKKIVVTIAWVGIIVLCGIYGISKSGVYTQNGVKPLSEDGELVVESLCTLDEDTNMVWAPKEIIAALRQRSGIKVLYGRNMWDAALGAYSYDEYSEEVKACFEWMEWAQAYDPTIDAELEALRYLDGIECGDYAKEQGVTVIVLPDGFDEELADLMETNLGVMARQIGGYYIIYCNYVLQFESE